MQSRRGERRTSTPHRVTPACVEFIRSPRAEAQTRVAMRCSFVPHHHHLSHVKHMQEQSRTPLDCSSMFKAWRIVRGLKTCSICGPVAGEASYRVARTDASVSLAVIAGASITYVEDVRLRLLVLPVLLEVMLRVVARAGKNSGRQAVTSCPLPADLLLLLHSARFS